MRWNYPRRRRHRRRCLPQAPPRRAAWLRQGPAAPPPRVSEPRYRLKNLYFQNLAVHHFESPFEDRTEFPESDRTEFPEPARVGGLGLEGVVIAARLPWQNGYAERFIGSLRRECLDHVIGLNERQLLHVVRAT